MTGTFQLDVARIQCRELLVEARRPMFERVRLVGRTVIAWPRRTVKHSQPIAFEIDSGHEIPFAAVEQGLSERERIDGPGSQSGTQVARRATYEPPEEDWRLSWRSAAVGKGESQISFYVANNDQPVETATVPDAISRVGRARHGWAVGCRDGFLYAFNPIGELLWRWETPGSSSFGLGDTSDTFMRPSPYHLTTNGDEALVGSWGSVWCVSSEGETLWSAMLASLDDDDEPASFPSTRDDTAATDIELMRIRRAAGRIHVRFGFPQHVTALLAEGDDWLVGGSEGDLFRFSKDGRLKTRLGISTSRVVPIYDIGGPIAAFGSQPNLWFIDRDAPVRLPDAYQWPHYLQAGCGAYILSHRHGDRHLGLIDEEGRLVLQIRCPRSITSIDVGEGLLAFVAATLVVLEVPGLSIKSRERDWHSLFLGS